MVIPVVPYFDFVEANLAQRGELFGALARILDSGALMAAEEVAAFEDEFADYVGVSHCVAVGTGTDALGLALAAVGAARQDVVLTTPNASPVVADAVLQTGPRLEFVDVDASTGLMDLNRLEDRLKDDAAARPKVVIPVHLFGQCADMDGLEELSRKYEFLIVEDARQAHGSQARGRKAGSFGIAAAFSFSPEKNLGALGQGGAVTTNDPELADAVRQVRAQGLGIGYTGKVELADSQMDALQAAALRVKLPRLDEHNARRRIVAAVYDKALSGTGYTEPLAVLPGNTPNRHIYTIMIPDRDDMRAYLDEQGVGTGLYYPVPLHLHPRFRRLGLRRGDFPEAEALALTTLSLPIRPELTPDQVAMVIDAVRSFGGSMR
ncbi:DegT/DnrJ/EryC1/StrS family aminotransferase [Fundidesulfovibrio terrae]|uniref:DegT/DnrJ/EryC1/StrS family aminotransferase n=1 Tax=Fundidesulfovibrio terrae TaxID=2922866 RepID=UPI001FAE8453|nr:DegT/DnrJ/EryC1/StrS family aminotransferase [Fundidesulfovibrio terrae]